MAGRPIFEHGSTVLQYPLAKPTTVTVHLPELLVYPPNLSCKWLNLVAVSKQLENSCVDVVRAKQMYRHISPLLEWTNVLRENASNYSILKVAIKLLI